MKIWSVIVSCALAVTMTLAGAPAEAAKRMGGGKSMGQQSSNVTKREAAPAAPAAAPGAAAADARSMPNIPSGSQATVVANNPYIPKDAGGNFSMMDYLPEATRITQPGGRIVVNGNSANPYFTNMPTAAQLESMGLRIEYQGPILPQYQGMTFTTTTGRPIQPSTMQSIVLVKK